MSIFSDNCESLCGSLPLDPVGGWQIMLDQLQALANTMAISGQVNGAPMAVEVGFVDSPDFNAWAVTIDDVDVIGINAGVIPILLGTFRGILSNSDIFSDVGSEDGQEPVRNLAKISDLADDLWCLAGVAPLKNAARDQRARDLADGALRYILLHELAHIINGHTSWLRLHGLTHLPERPEPGTDEFAGLQRQTLEYDADMWAAQQILGIALRAVVDSSQLPSRWLLPQQNPFGSIPDAVAAATAAITITHILFSRISEMERIDPLLFTHPPAFYRRWVNTDQIAHNLAIRAGLDHEEWFKFSHDLANKIAILFYKMFDEVDLKAIDNNILDTIKKYNALYHQTWAEMRPELDLLKRSGHLAPAQTS